MINNNIPVHFCVDFEPIKTNTPVQCPNISVETNGVEIPMNETAFVQMIENFFSNPNYMCVFDSGDADTILGKLDTIILL